MKMKALKIGLAVLAAAALGSSCFAQAPLTPFLGVGSSAAFNSYALAGAANVGAGSITTSTLSSEVVSSGVATVTCSGDCDVVTGGSITIAGNVSTPTGCSDGTFTVSSVVSATQFKYTTNSCNNGTYHGGTIAGPYATGAPLCTNTPNGTLGGSGTATNVYVWTQKSSGTTVEAADARVNSSGTTIPTVTQKTWVEWVDPVDATGTDVKSICVYQALDSAVGNRVFFATSSVTGFPAGTISCSAASFPVASANQLHSGNANLFPAEYALPQSVCNDLNGVPWNAAPSDIRAEDAEMETTRVCNAYSATSSGMGYGCTSALGGISPDTITSAYSATGVEPSAFAISGNDPIVCSGCTAHAIAHSLAGTDKLAFKEFDVAGQVLLILANNIDTSGLGAAGFTDITDTALANAFSGHADYVSDICNPTVCTDAAALTVLVREPLSGTYTTFDFQGPHSKRFLDSGQESLGTTSGTYYVANNPADPSVTMFAPKYTGKSNPFEAQQSTAKSLKARVYGTGEMVNVVAENSGDSNCKHEACATLDGDFTTANDDLLGYAFFSYGNVGPVYTNCSNSNGCVKYLTVNGVDPLGFGGVLPDGCSTPPCTTTNFTNISNGTYPLWNILRTTTSGELGFVKSGTLPGSFVCGPTASVCLMINAVASEISGVINDLDPLANMTVFRSHYTATLPGHNGFKTGVAEEGGDVAGARLSDQSEVDFDSDFSPAEQLNEYQ